MNSLTLSKLDCYLKENGIPVIGIKVLPEWEEAADNEFTLSDDEGNIIQRFDISFSAACEREDVQALLDEFDCRPRRPKTHAVLTQEILQWINQPATANEKIARLARLTSRIAAFLLMKHSELLADSNFPDIDSTEVDE